MHSFEFRPYENVWKSVKANNNRHKFVFVKIKTTRS